MPEHDLSAVWLALTLGSKMHRELGSGHREALGLPLWPLMQELLKY